MIKTGIHAHGDGEEVDQEKTEETVGRGQEKKADSRQTGAQENHPAGAEAVDQISIDGPVHSPLQSGRPVEKGDRCAGDCQVPFYREEKNGEAMVDNASPDPVDQRTQNQDPPPVENLSVCGTRFRGVFGGRQRSLSHERYSTNLTFQFQPFWFLRKAAVRAERVEKSGQPGKLKTCCIASLVKIRNFEIAKMLAIRKWVGQRSGRGI